MTAASSSEERSNRAISDIRAGGSVSVGGGNIIRRGSDGQIYLVTPGSRGERYNITSQVGLNAARRDNAITPLNETQVRATVIAAAAPIPRGVVTPPTPPATSTREERPARSTGGGPAANSAPAPTAVVDERLRGEGVNTNTELTEDDGAGGRRLKARTSNSAFSTGVRTSGAFNIGRFRSEVSGADSVLPTHSFLVVFAPMIWTRNKFSSQNLDSLLTMRCDNVVLPSVNLLQEQNIRRYGFGPVENVAYGVNVGDFTLQFIVDKGALVVEFFEEWLNTIVNRDSFGGANMNNNINGRKPYEIAYKDTYNCPNVNVFVYDRAQNAVMEYNIYDVFPTGIQSMNMSWGEENNLMKLNITFSFTDLRIKRVPAKERVDDQSFNESIRVSATGVYADALRAAGETLSTFDPTGARGLELTDLSNETITIGGRFRTRGSVTPVQLSTPSTSSTPQVRAPTTRLPSGVPFTIPS